MFIFFPILASLPTLIYLAAALLPAVFLLSYAYRHDTIEKEPPLLLLSLLLGGCIAALCSGVLEQFGEAALRVWVSPHSSAYTVLLAFLVVALAEEGTKLLLLRLRSWNHPAFNYRFDGLLYSVFVSLGFAALENVMYVSHYGLSVALPRAVLSIPGHMSFAIFMGVYYGRAKHLANHGDMRSSRITLLFGYLIAVFLHGFYDTCAMLNTSLTTGIFIVFIIITFLSAFRTLKRESAADEPISHDHNRYENNNDSF